MSINSRSSTVAVSLALAVLTGCGSQSPLAPAKAPPLLSGYVYEALTAFGEPPIADVLITVRDPFGVDTTVMSDRSGFYSVSAPIGPVVVTAAKAGYETREVRFEIADSIVLNFSLRPTRNDAARGEVDRTTGG
jgi:hypothetical protein